MFEEIAAIAAILLIIPGWAVGLVAIIPIFGNYSTSERKWNEVTMNQWVENIRYES